MKRFRSLFAALFAFALILGTPGISNAAAVTDWNRNINNGAATPGAYGNWTGGFAGMTQQLAIYTVFLSTGSLSATGGSYVQLSHPRKATRPIAYWNTKIHPMPPGTESRGFYGGHYT